MVRFSSLALAALSSLALLPGGAVAQSWTQCNPLQTNPALGLTINVDFTKGAVNSFAAGGTPTYDSNGASFTVARPGDAPQLISLFYIMFGRVEIVMKAAPGAGIVSSVVLQSDDLDEIDMEWLGANPNQMQSNYFGKGQVTSYNRGQFHDVQGTQTNWIKYTVDWTQDRIVWLAGDTVLRTLSHKDAEANQYPQTPMQVKFGSWSGGDAGNNAPGTVKWAQGPTDFTRGPFTMMVKSVVITDYSTGKQYVYSDTTGSWQSIRAEGGFINGNLNSRGGITATATAVGSTAPTPAAVPVGGIGHDGSNAAATQTGWPWVAGAAPSSGSIPAGWYIAPDGKIRRENSASTPVPSGVTLLLGPFLMGILAIAVRLI
ncbi:Extracellular glycosidase CRH11 [Escovopsis weberi]|uniref:chitinase n=1 Tax=Escovopsis weberi TaxID=150374 RepID=A0A0M9VU03_ESCWE|nr:Extracellular glycosidase CRH11 [Escovopsis weberi]